MKKVLILLDVIIMFIAAIAFFSYKEKLAMDREVSSAKEVSTNSELSFGVIGDLHENIDSFNKLAEDFHEINPKMDALIMNGDMVGQGIPSQYESVKKALDKKSSILPKIIISNIGNHEFFDYNIEQNSPEQVEVFKKRYLDFSGEEFVYHDKWIKDYHFISLGSESGNTKELGSMKAFLSDKQLKWLEEKLSEKYVKGKPIFVFLHQPLNNNGKGFTGVEQGQQVKDILSKYPEVILFTSHTHAPLDEKGIKTDLPFTTVHTGAVAYTIVMDSSGNRQNVNYNQGLYVEVNNGKVTIKGRSFNDKKWLFSKDI
ncbi:metallophosphoesterase family protein [Clostridium sp. 'White wine YQ']|uniref:metallophosphoesterase family protein n=1 Tax=Clostridium sp. 'White wine YQ' TaxID=3027474 RepID=UPI00236616FF|nr:metallophosphoesterase [Clostridium sp. 'White wine YQ']MDD7795269.1 metallophosphoesterase [Clostridium sp. 'White wine YQ']